MTTERRDRRASFRLYMLLDGNLNLCAALHAIIGRGGGGRKLGTSSRNIRQLKFSIYERRWYDNNDIKSTYVRAHAFLR